MLDLSADPTTIPHHQAMEDIVDVICTKTQNRDRGFFRIVTAYFFAKMAASMRATVLTKDRGSIPVSVYATALATSGFGKGHSVNILEETFLSLFKDRFTKDTLPVLAERRLWLLATERSVASSRPEEEEKEKLDKSYANKGAIPFTFSKATAAAIQQLRQKLLMAGAGAIQLQIDEIGSNISNATVVEALNVFLELYDQGLVKDGITKNTAENVRDEELDGKTPANALLFGTPAKLLDGGQNEEQFFSFLDTGYARRCLFAWGERIQEDVRLTPEEMYRQLIAPVTAQNSHYWATHFELLADPAKFEWEAVVEDDVGIELLRYRFACEQRAEVLNEHEEIRKAEMSHRYYKALKLAGAYAFVDESPEVTMLHLHQAIKLVEESGQAFERMMTREKPAVRLAKYLAACGTEVTHYDLSEKLPFYKSAIAVRKDMMELAAGWGYKNNVIIRKRFEGSVELFWGETLKETNLDEIIVSYSDHFAYDYEGVRAPWDQLDKLMLAPAGARGDTAWCNHHFENQHRNDDNTVAGFNTVIFDFDGSVPLDVVHALLADYRFLTYTTKRHTETENRFRLVLPINYVLTLDKEDYKAFIEGLAEWLPIPADLADSSSKQRSHKWLSNPNGAIHYNEGQLLDCFPFIPKTSKNEAYQAQMKDLQSLDNLERWFAQRIQSGNRNNEMIRFALALVDSGMSYIETEKAVYAFNSKLSEPLAHDELRNTILVTVAKKINGNP